MSSSALPHSFFPLRRHLSRRCPSATHPLRPHRATRHVIDGRALLVVAGIERKETRSTFAAFALLSFSLDWAAGALLLKNDDDDDDDDDGKIKINSTSSFLSFFSLLPSYNNKKKTGHAARPRLSGGRQGRRSWSCGCSSFIIHRSAEEQQQQQQLAPPTGSPARLLVVFFFFVDLDLDERRTEQEQQRQQQQQRLLLYILLRAPLWRSNSLVFSSPSPLFLAARRARRRRRRRPRPPLPGARKQRRFRRLRLRHPCLWRRRRRRLRDGTGSPGLRRPAPPLRRRRL